MERKKEWEKERERQTDRKKIERLEEREQNGRMTEREREIDVTDGL